MITFYDYDPSNPFVVSGELQTITDGKVRLNYTPLKNSVVIPGFTQAATSSPGTTEFYIDYQDSSEYRLATQYVFFSNLNNGTTVSISYQGVSTLILAKHFNEIKNFMETNGQFSQVTKLGVVAPKVVDIPIKETVTFNGCPIEILKFQEGATGTVVTECNFDNSDASDFTYDNNYIIFDGTMREKTNYPVTMGAPVPLASGYLSESDSIHGAYFKSMSDYINTIGESNIWVTNNISVGTVSKITGTSVVSTVTVGSYPQAICSDPSGNVWVANTGSNTVSKITGTSVVSTVTVGSSPRGICSDPSGNVWVANTNSNTVSKITGTSVVSTVTVGSSPQGICSDPSGNIWVTNQTSNTVSKITGTSVVSTVTVESVPQGICSDPSGNIWVTNHTSNTVSKITGTSVVATVTVGSGPVGICSDPSAF